MRQFLFLAVFALICASCGGNRTTGPGGDDVIVTISIEAKAFADEHWNEQKYLEWFQAWENWLSYPYYSVEPLEEILAYTLPEISTDLYYEMIGVGIQFIYGWDDVNGVDSTGLNYDPLEETLCPIYEVIYQGEAGIDTVYFDPWIQDVTSTRRFEYQELLEAGGE